MLQVSSVQLAGKKFLCNIIIWGWKPPPFSTIGNIMPATLSGPINISGFIASGGVSQILAQPNANRTRFNLINVDLANDLWWSPFGPAGPNLNGSIRIPANGGFLSFNGDAPGTTYHIYGDVTNQQFTAWVDA